MKNFGSVGEAFVEVGLDIKPFKRQLALLRKSTKKVGTLIGRDLSQTTERFGKVLAISAASMSAFTGIIGSLSTAILVTVKEFAEFEQRMANVQSVVQGTDAELAKLSSLAMKLGPTFNYSAMQAADSLYYLGSAGLNTRQIAEMFPNVLALARATMSDLAMTAETTVNAINAFGMETSEAKRLVNVFAATISSSQATLEKLRTSMGYVAPIAKIVGYSVEETAAALGILYNRGLEASMAGTGLRMSLTRLSKPTRQAQEVLDKLGLSAEDINPYLNDLGTIIDKLSEKGATLAELSGLVGVRAGTTLANLVSAGSDALADLQEKITGTNKAFKMANIQMNTIQGLLGRTTKEVTNLAIEFGKLWKDEIRMIISMVKELVDWFRNLSPAMRTVVKLTTVFVGGLSLLGTGLSAVGIALSGLIILYTKLISKQVESNIATNAMVGANAKLTASYAALTAALAANTAAMHANSAAAAAGLGPRIVKPLVGGAVAGGGAAAGEGAVAAAGGGLLASAAIIAAVIAAVLAIFGTIIYLNRKKAAELEDETQKLKQKTLETLDSVGKREAAIKKETKTTGRILALQKMGLGLSKEARAAGEQLAKDIENTNEVFRKTSEKLSESQGRRPDSPTWENQLANWRKLNDVTEETEEQLKKLIKGFVGVTEAALRTTIALTPTEEERLRAQEKQTALGAKYLRSKAATARARGDEKYAIELERYAGVMEAKSSVKQQIREMYDERLKIMDQMRENERLLERNNKIIQSGIDDAKKTEISRVNAKLRYSQEQLSKRYENLAKSIEQVKKARDAEVEQINATAKKRISEIEERKAKERKTLEERYTKYLMGEHAKRWESTEQFEEAFLRATGQKRQIQINKLKEQIAGWMKTGFGSFLKGSARYVIRSVEDIEEIRAGEGAFGGWAETTNKLATIIRKQLEELGTTTIGGEIGGAISQYLPKFEAFGVVTEADVNKTIVESAKRAENETNRRIQSYEAAVETAKTTKDINKKLERINLGLD